MYVPEKNTVVVSRDIIFNEEGHMLSTVEAESMSMSDIETDTNSSTNDQEDETVINENRITPRLRNREHIREPQMLEDYVLIAERDELMSNTQAMISNNSQQLKAAIDDEIKLLVENIT